MPTIDDDEIRLLNSGRGERLLLNSPFVKLVIIFERSLLLLNDELGNMSEWNWSSLKK